MRLSYQPWKLKWGVARTLFKETVMEGRQSYITSRLAVMGGEFTDGSKSRIVLNVNLVYSLGIICKQVTSWDRWCRKQVFTKSQTPVERTSCRTTLKCTCRGLGGPSSVIYGWQSWTLKGLQLTKFSPVSGRGVLLTRLAWFADCILGEAPVFLIGTLWQWL